MATSSVEGIAGIPVFIIVQQLPVLFLLYLYFVSGIPVSSRGPAMSRSKSMERMNDPIDQAPEWRSAADPVSSKHRPYRN